MFWVSPAPSIRITQTLITTTGTSHGFEDVTIKSDKKGYMDEQLPHFSHDQIEVAARPYILFNRILSSNSCLVPVVITTVCVFLMMGESDIRNS